MGSPLAQELAVELKMNLDKMPAGGDVLQGVQVMGPRFIFAALLIAFGFALVLATLTTMRHVSMHSTSLRTAHRGG